MFNTYIMKCMCVRVCVRACERASVHACECKLQDLCINMLCYMRNLFINTVNFAWVCSLTSFCQKRFIPKRGCNDSIQLLTFVSVDMKFYWTVNFILTDAKRRSIWFVYCSITLHVHWNESQQLLYNYWILSIWSVYCSITLHVHRNKSQQLFYYIKSNFQLKGLSFTPNFCWQTMRH